MTEKMTLNEYLESLLAEGRHYFTVEELEKNLSLKKESIPVILSKLSKKKKLRMVRRGFGILFEWGREELDLSYYVDAMMKHIQADYYVGLLAAASYWGASHQATMSSQVVSNKLVSGINFQKSRVEFITKKRGLASQGIIRLAGIGGYYNISSPELTAIDLLRFPGKSGHLNNIATMIKDLAPQWDVKRMKVIFQDIQVPAATLQRLGYILEYVLEYDKEASYLLNSLEKKQAAPSFLNQSSKKEGARKSDYPYNERWKLYINTKVEID